MIRERVLEDVLRAWGLELGRVREDLRIDGSPDRCEFRTVVEDGDGNLFVLESVRAADVERKRSIARALSFLAEKGLSQVRSYVPSDPDDYVVFRANAYWQLAPYVEGVPLARPEYAFEGWRGPALADFLIDLRDRTRGAPLFDSAPSFSIVSFIRDLARTVERREPLLYLRIRPALVHLEQDFMAAHDRFPVRFCHGDYHPLNVIWSEKGIRAVIDWEFLGTRPELFDAAMMIGCLGMEDPQSLTGDLVFSFIERLKASGAAAAPSWAHLFDLVLALRFAWLADWLKRSDAEMIELEAVYMGLLLDNRGIFARSWEV
ncbi:MAG: aminoglycoside phosphotransferase family protein [Candidatus Aminicenantes bacterium]